MYIYIYIYIYMSIQICRCIHIYIYTCIYLFIMNICIYLCSYKHTYIRTYIHTYIHAHTCVCLCVCVCASVPSAGSQRILRVEPKFISEASVPGFRVVTLRDRSLPMLHPGSCERSWRRLAVAGSSEVSGLGSRVQG